MSQESHRLWYRQPAENFNEALPLGNGRLGAMVYGGVPQERLHLNEDTLWAGTRAPAPLPHGPQALQACRKLLRKGKYQEAQQLVAEQLLTDFNQPYLPAGDLLIEVEAWAGMMPAAYSRELDFAAAESRTTFEMEGQKHTRTCYVSAPDQVLVWSWEVEDGTLPDFVVKLSCPLRHDLQWRPDGGQLAGQAPSHVVWPGVDERYQQGEGITYTKDSGDACRYAIELAVQAPEAALTPRTDDLLVAGATSVTVCLAIATDATSDDPSQVCRQTLREVGRQSAKGLRQRHVDEHRAAYERVELTLGGGEERKLARPTDERLFHQIQQEADIQLVALAFHYGRYLLLASSRPGTQPSNLMGIWNNLVQPPWWSNYTMNINLQMNYWPAEVANLSECHEPLFALMEELQRSGQETARVHYGCRGWCAHHQTDWHRQTTPVGRLEGKVLDEAPCYAMWPLAGAWLCRHLWEHYLYTGDEDFLRERAWPLLKGAAEFVLDWVVEDSAGRHLTTAPSTSPENFFRRPNGSRIVLGTGSAMDLSIIRDLLSLCQTTILRLELTEDELLAEMEATLSRLAPIHFDEDGGIREMNEGWKQWEPGHRHLSHLYGLFPGDEFLNPKRPELREAARRSLELRGEEGTGWSLAWKLCLQARLQDAAACERLLVRYFQTVPSTVMETANDGGGTYPNLLAACPPMMIDANFGFTAGVAEMLLQSQGGEIQLLPALPPSWRRGSFRGLRARGGVEVSAVWDDGHLLWAHFVSAKAIEAAIVYRGSVLHSELAEGSHLILRRQDFVI